MFGLYLFSYRIFYVEGLVNFFPYFTNFDQFWFLFCFQSGLGEKIEGKIDGE